MPVSEQKITERFYGRRSGRPLRPRQKQLVEQDLPKYRLDIPEFLKSYDKRWLEIGFGGGEHLAWHAAQNPNIGMIGCEPFINGVASLLKHREEGGQENIRIQPDDARPVLDNLPDASIDRVFVLHPDPWPKKRHWFRRFIRPTNLDRLARIMRDGAELRLASDDMPLLRWMLFHALNHGAFEWTAQRADDWRLRPDDWPETRYERKSKSQGRTPIYLSFIRKNRT